MANAPGETITVTAEHDTCYDILPKTADGHNFAEPSLIQEARFKICEAGRLLSTTAAHLWDDVKGFFSGLVSDFNSLWDWTVNLGNDLIGDAKSFAQAVADDATSLLEWIKKEVAAGGWWILGGLVLVGALVFFPEELGSLVGSVAGGTYSAARSGISSARKRAKKRHA